MVGGGGTVRMGNERGRQHLSRLEFPPTRDFAEVRNVSIKRGPVHPAED